MLGVPALAGGDAARFRTEAEAVARLQHPNIVQVFEVGEHDGRPFLALEYVEGGSLLQLAGTPQPPLEAARLLKTLARAMHHAHQQGIIHRDLKPANILLAEATTAAAPRSASDPGCNALIPGAKEVKWLNYVPKITDFGLAKSMEDAAVPGLGRLRCELGLELILFSAREIPAGRGLIRVRPHPFGREVAEEVRDRARRTRRGTPWRLESVARALKQGPEARAHGGRG